MSQGGGYAVFPLRTRGAEAQQACGSACGSGGGIWRPGPPLRAAPAGGQARGGEGPPGRPAELEVHVDQGDSRGCMEAEKRRGGHGEGGGHLGQAATLG